MRVEILFACLSAIDSSICVIFAFFYVDIVPCSGDRRTY